MKKLQYKISLEQFKCRTPNTLPSVFDNSGNAYYFNKSHITCPLDARERLLNYGFYPSDIETPLQSGKTISYSSIIRIYAFMEKYHRNLLSEGKCSTISYRDYAHKSKYEETSNMTFDELYEYYGGDEMYNWLKDNVFLVFTISEEFADGWDKKTLNIGEFSYWFGWMTRMHSKYENVTDCKESEDCCECEKYFEKGGNAMYEEMKSFIDNITEPFDDKIFESYFTLPLLFETNIDDMGEMSIFSNEWSGYYSYNSGTTSIHNEKDWVLATDTSGHIYSNTFKEFYFGNYEGMTDLEREYHDYEGNELSGDTDQWERSIDLYYKEHKDEFNYSGNTEYAYKGDNIVFSPTPRTMADYYNVTTTDHGFALIDGFIYEAFEQDYIIYKRVTKNVDASRFFRTIPWDYKDVALVYYEDEENKINPYVSINNHIYHGYYDPVAKKWTFDFSRSLCDNTLDTSKCEILSGSTFIVYDEHLYLVDTNTNTVTIKKKVYPLEEKHVSIDGDNFAVVGDKLNVCVYNSIDDNKVSTYKFEETTVDYGNSVDIDEANEFSYGYFVENEKVGMLSPYVIYKFDYVSGVTESKLSTFRNDRVAFDIIGNELKGDFTFVDGKQISEGEYLDFYFRNGVTRNLELIQVNEDERIYWGDYLSDIKVYYKTHYNTIDDEFCITLSESGCTEEIINLINKKNDYISSEDIEDEEIERYDFEHLYCKFTYYNGAMISISGDSVSFEEFVDNGKINGVKYTEECEIVEKQCPYHITDKEAITLNYFDIIQMNKEVVMNEYGDVKVEVPFACFETNISSFNENRDNLFFADDNGFICLPTIREEYKFGISSLEKLEGDIYINRGKLQAIDKHMKLMEVDSMEDLLNYGNGYFNIKNG